MDETNLWGTMRRQTTEATATVPAAAQVASVFLSAGAGAVGVDVRRIVGAA